ncbi:MAG: hypothetical protein IKN31_06175 [Bacteroidales bacterium]|nr:hypothetical protein [Bacteroidales bacterium]
MKVILNCNMSGAIFTPFFTNINSQARTGLAWWVRTVLTWWVRTVLAWWVSRDSRLWTKMD